MLWTLIPDLSEVESSGPGFRPSPRGGPTPACLVVWHFSPGDEPHGGRARPLPADALVAVGGAHARGERRTALLVAAGTCECTRCDRERVFRGAVAPRIGEGRSHSIPKVLGTGSRAPPPGGGSFVEYR